MPSILFVCSANQCRSPMARVLFEALLEAKGAQGEWWVDSAGVWASEGAPATANAQLAMAERGLNLSGHQAQPATQALLRRFDLIVVMEQEHKEVLLAENPGLAGVVYTLRELAGGQGDFEDPVGGSLAVYRAAAEELEKLLEAAWGRIVDEIGSSKQ